RPLWSTPGWSRRNRRGPPSSATRGSSTSPRTPTGCICGAWSSASSPRSDRRSRPNRRDAIGEFAGRLSAWPYCRRLVLCFLSVLGSAGELREVFAERQLEILPTAGISPQIVQQLLGVGIKFF